MKISFASTLFFSLIYSAYCCFDSDLDTPIYGYLYPDRINVEVGGVILFNCTLNKDLVDKGQLKIQNVYFTKENRRIYSKYKIIDNYTVQLKKENASLADTGAYGCNFSDHLRNEENGTIICASDAVVGFKPSPVKDFKCIYNYRRNLSCTWASVDNPIPTNYSLSFSPDEYDSDKRPCEKYDFKPVNESSSLLLHSCLWPSLTGDDLPHRSSYYFLIEADNKLGYKNESFLFDLASIVLLKEPINLNFNTTNHILKWSPPSGILRDEMLKTLLQYRIYVIKTNENIIINTIGFNQTQPNRTIIWKIDNLKPYTNYTFNISVNVRDPLNDYWSKNASITRLTDPKAPLLSPNLTDESFEILELPTSSKHNVKVYWQDVPFEEHYGSQFVYLIKYKEDDGYDEDSPKWRNVTTTNPYVELTLNSNLNYKMKIYSKNVIGSSEKFTKFLIKRSDDILWYKRLNDLKHLINVFTFDNDTYEIEWTTINNDDVDFKLFWCSTTIRNDCWSNFRWKTLDHNEIIRKHSNQYKYIFKDDNYHIDLNHRNYKFGLSFSTNDRSTGIIWSECIANSKKEISEIKLKVKHQATWALVEWTLKCPVERRLFDKFYIIYEDEANVKMNETANKMANQYRLTNLRPNTLYSVKVCTTIDCKNKPTVFTFKTLNDNHDESELYHFDLTENNELIIGLKPAFNLSTLPASSSSLKNVNIFDENFKLIIKETMLGDETTKIIKNFNTCDYYKSGKNFYINVTLINNPRLLTTNPAFNANTIASENSKLIDSPSVSTESLKDSFVDSENNVPISRTTLATNVYTGRNKLDEFDSTRRNRTDFTAKIPIDRLCKNHLIDSKIIYIFSIICIIISLILFYSVFYGSYRFFKKVKKTNDEIAPDIPMEEKTFWEKYQNKNSPYKTNDNEQNSINANGYNYSCNNSNSSSSNNNNSSSNYKKNHNNSIDSNRESFNEAESCLNESDSTNFNMLQNNPSNQTIMAPNGINSDFPFKMNHNSNYLQRYDFIQDKSRDSGVSDLNHQDNLEYFYSGNQQNQDDDSNQPLLFDSNNHHNFDNSNSNNNNRRIKPEIMNFNNNNNNNFIIKNNNNNNNVMKPLINNPLTSTPSSSISSPEHNLNNNNLRNVQNMPKNSNSKATYVVIQNASNFLPHSHTTNLPETYNINHV